ncbi:MAG: hypothetical protein ACKO3N_13460, partial [Verrucomicrobiota bacterium]
HGSFSPTAIAHPNMMKMTTTEMAVAWASNEALTFSSGGIFCQTSESSASCSEFVAMQGSEIITLAASSEHVTP